MPGGDEDDEPADPRDWDEDDDQGDDEDDDELPPDRGYPASWDGFDYDDMWMGGEEADEEPEY